MMTRIAIVVCWVMALALALFLILPLLVIAAASFSPTPVFDLPLSGASLRWYGRIGRLDGFWPSLWLSLEIALFSTAISLVCGTLAAIAIARGKLPGAEVFATALVSPLMMPGLVLGIALLQGFRMSRLFKSILQFRVKLFGLDLTFFSLARSTPCICRKFAGYHRRDRKGGPSDKILRIGNGPGIYRRQEKVVKRQHCNKRC